MATIEFTEYRYPKAIYGALPPLPWGQAGATRQVTIGAASAASEPFGAATQLIVIANVGAACRIAIADAAGLGALNHSPLSRLLAAGAEYAFAVEPGQALAVIEAVDTVDPEFTSEDAIEVEEGVTLAHLLTADEPVDFTLTGGADQAQFELAGDGVTLRWAADGVQDFGAPADAGTNNVYNVEITATDEAGNATVQPIAVTVTEAV